MFVFQQYHNSICCYCDTSFCLHANVSLGNQLEPSVWLLCCQYLKSKNYSVIDREKKKERDTSATQTASTNDVVIEGKKSLLLSFISKNNCYKSTLFYCEHSVISTTSLDSAKTRLTVTVQHTEPCEAQHYITWHWQSRWLSDSELRCTMQRDSGLHAGTDDLITSVWLLGYNWQEGEGCKEGGEAGQRECLEEWTSFNRRSASLMWSISCFNSQGYVFVQCLEKGHRRLCTSLCVNQISLLPDLVREGVQRGRFVRQWFPK